MFLRLISLFSLTVVIAAGGVSSFAQETRPEEKPGENTQPALILGKDSAKNPTAEQVVESSIFIYGLGGGRAVLNQIRKTAMERGKISVVNAEGKTEEASYSRWTQRAESLDKEKIRLDQEFPGARYSLIYNDKVFGIYNDTVFTPTADAASAFQNQIVHGLDAMLRYKENGSRIELAGKEKILGVEYYLIDLTDKEDRKTRFYVSAKTFRVMMLDYEMNGTKFRRKFYDYNYAQGTLVPFRSVLWAGDKIIEEIDVGTVTFGQKIDESMFSEG